MNLRERILIMMYKLFPFSLKGDMQPENLENTCDISCIITFYGRIDLLQGILFSLAEQDLQRERFEVILVEDRGGTAEGRNICERFSSMLNIRYFALPQKYGKMGYSRNYGLSRARGEYILFLDDDTIILQKDFISVLIDEFKKTGSKALVPRGSAAYCLLKGKYSFHDPFFPTNRCMAYDRGTLNLFGGFVSEIIGQEDVEFTIRYIASGEAMRNSEKLNYLHPPLIISNLGKPASVGQSFAGLIKRYPLIIWFMLLLNGLRYLPYLLLPVKTKWKMQGKFSLGFLLGLMYSIKGKGSSYTG